MAREISRRSFLKGGLDARFYSISGYCAFRACNGVANGRFILYYSKKEVSKRMFVKL